MPEPMAKADFLALSTRVMEDLKRWVDEARDYYNLAPERLETMLAAIEYVDHVTVQVAKVKEAREEKKESQPE